MDKTTIDERKTSYAEAFGRNLKAALKQSNKYHSAYKLAEAVGLSTTALSTIMSGKSLPSLFNAVQLADALDTSIDDLLNRDGNYINISKTTELSDCARNLMWMEEHDIIDIKYPHEDVDIQHAVERLRQGDGFMITFQNKDLSEFFKNYATIVRMANGNGDRASDLSNSMIKEEINKLQMKEIRQKVTLEMELEHLDNQDILLKK